MKHIPLTATYCFMFVTAGLVSGALGPSLLYLSKLVDASVAEISVLFTTRAMGVMLGAFIAGQMFDRIKGNRYLMAMLLLAFVALAIIPFTETLWVLMLVFALLGFAEVSINTGGNIMVLWLHKEQSAAPLSLLHLSYGLGNMVAPLVLIAGLWISGDYGSGFWLIALYAMIFPLLLFKQASPQAPTAANNVQSKPINRYFYISFLLLAFLYVSFEITIAGWLSTYGVLMGLSETDAAILVTWYFVAICIGRLISVPILRLFTLAQTMFAMLGFCLLGSVLILFDFLPLPFIALILGFGSSAIFPIAFSYVNQIMTFTGKLTGYVFMGCGLGAMIMPSLTGPLIEYYSAAVYPIILLCMAIALGLAWINLRQAATRI